MAFKISDREIRGLVSFSVMAAIAIVGTTLIERREEVDYQDIAPQEEVAEKRQSTKYKAPVKKPTRTIEPQPFYLDTVSAQYLSATGIMTLKRAEAVVWTHKKHKFPTMDSLRKTVYVLDDESADKLAKYAIFSPYKKPATKTPQTPELVNINTADSVTLCSVTGIGAVTAQKIIARRQELGGFHSAKQLRLDKIVTFEDNYNTIIKEIILNYYDITKIDINFASANVLSAHPYIEERQGRKIESIVQRIQKRGGTVTPEKIRSEKIFTEEEFEKVLPYLDFGESQDGDTTGTNAQTEGL